MTFVGVNLVASAPRSGGDDIVLEGDIGSGGADDAGAPTGSGMDVSGYVTHPAAGDDVHVVVCDDIGGGVPTDSAHDDPPQVRYTKRARV